jgi:hypothetical protein
MNDLVKRLRSLVGQYIGDADIDDELQGAADCIEKLEAAIVTYSSAVAGAQVCNEELNRALNRVIDRWEIQSARIEKLEEALREIAALGYWDGDSAMNIARKALEGKDD